MKACFQISIFKAQTFRRNENLFEMFFSVFLKKSTLRVKKELVLIKRKKNEI